VRIPSKRRWTRVVEDPAVLAVVRVGGWDANTPKEFGALGWSTYTTNIIFNITLTIFTESLLIFDFFHNLIKQVIKKFMCILMHGGAEKFVDFLELVDECAGWHNTFVFGMFGYVVKEGTQSGKQRGWWHGDRRMEYMRGSVWNWWISYTSYGLFSLRFWPRLRRRKDRSGGWGEWWRLRHRMIRNLKEKFSERCAKI
jgi:hypothetical protein